MKEIIAKKRMEVLLLLSFLIVWAIFLTDFFVNTKVQNESITGFGILTLGIIFLLLRIFRRNKKYGELLGMLHYYCNPYGFSSEVRTLLKLEMEKEFPKDKNRLLLYLSIGYYAEGKFQEAMETLQSIDLFYHYRNAGFIANYFHRQFLVSLEMERQDVAWGSLVKMRDAIANLRERKLQRLFTGIYDIDMHILNVARGEYEGAESVFKGMFYGTQSNYERSFASFLLGGLYKSLGKEAEAKDAYGYVVEHGNTLHIAEKAAEYLGLKG